MAFDDELAIALYAAFSCADGIDEQIRQFGLHPRVEMNLRLLEDDDRLPGDVEALDNHREHLTHAESNIRKSYLGLVRAGPDEYLVLLPVFSQPLYAKITDEFHRLESSGDELGKNAGLLSCFQVESSILSCRQNGLDRTIALYSNVIGGLTGPEIQAPGILPQRAHVEEAAKHSFQLEYQV